MNKPILLLIAFSAVACFAQEPLNYGLTGVRRLQFEAALKPENYERGKSAWEKSGNAKGYLTAKECQRLWDSSIAFDLHVNIQDAQIEDVGIRVTNSLFKNQKQFWEKLLVSIELETSGNVPTDFCELLLKIHEAAASSSQSSTESVTMFVKYYEHYSLVRKRKEKWLLLDFALFKKELPIYDRALIYRFLTNSSKVELITIHPYPDDGEVNVLFAEIASKPLQPNRNKVAGTGPGMRPPTPIVDDGLTQAERELKHQFVLRDQQSLGEYQIESTGISAFTLPFRYNPQISRMELAMDFPPGRVMTYDQIHRTCGEFAKREQVTAKYYGENLLFVFEIQPYEHGKYTYSRIRFDVVPFVGD